MPLISVIVPVYKCEEYLEDCVNSILNQTFSDFEIILVDDGSPDKCGKICDELAKKHNNIIALHQTNQGQAAARNKGIKIARAEWIHFVDSDDLIHPQMLEILYGAVDENTGISMCGVAKEQSLPENFFLPKSGCSFKKHPINEKELLLMYHDKYQYWIACAKLIKKNIIEKYPFTEGRIFEDNGVVFKWINQTEFVNITDEQLYFYRINPKSTTNVDFSLKNVDFLWAKEEQINFYKDSDFEEMKKTVYRNYAVSCAKMYYRLLENTNWTNEAKKIKKKLHAFMKKYGKFTELKEDWEFNMVYGVLYPKPIRIIFRLARYIDKITN